MKNILFSWTLITDFAENWDEELINMYKQLQELGYKKPLLTGYLPSYEAGDDPAGRINIPWLMNFDRFSPDGILHTIPATIDNFKELSEPVHARFYSPHFGFTTGNFVKEVPHDPNLYFHGKEHSISVKGIYMGI